jgi:hypothetical protein
VTWTPPKGHNTSSQILKWHATSQHNIANIASSHVNSTYCSRSSYGRSKNPRGLGFGATTVVSEPALLCTGGSLRRRLFVLLIANTKPLEGARLGFRLAGAQRRHISTKIASENDQRNSGAKQNSMIKPWQAYPKVLVIFTRNKVSNGKCGTGRLHSQLAYTSSCGTVCKAYEQ